MASPGEELPVIFFELLVNDRKDAPKTARHSATNN